jgi:hypothetical protein
MVNGSASGPDYPPGRAGVTSRGRNSGRKGKANGAHTVARSAEALKGRVGR